MALDLCVTALSTRRQDRRPSILLRAHPHRARMVKQACNLPPSKSYTLSAFHFRLDGWAAGRLRTMSTIIYSPLLRNKCLSRPLFLVRPGPSVTLVSIDMSSSGCGIRQIHTLDDCGFDHDKTEIRSSNWVFQIFNFSTEFQVLVIVRLVNGLS